MNNAIRNEVEAIEATIEFCGAYNLTGDDQSVIDWFEASDDYRVMHDHGIHRLTVVIKR